MIASSISNFSLSFACVSLLATCMVAAQTNRRNLASLGIAETGFPPCDILISSGLDNRILLPTSDSFEHRIQSWWSANARYRPWCLFQPQNTQEVSDAVKALNQDGYGAGNWHIAIRGGGHSFPGSNNIADGITIDLGMMNRSTYDRTRNIASIEPGAAWKNVYRDLQNENVTVTGGRDGGVGVGGFLIGGGISYYTPRNGFGCDTIVNYEIVLPNGTVVEANALENRDLWRALKGGGSNFGIVTRFDLQAIPAVDLAFGITIVAANHSEEVNNAIVEFTDRQEERKDDALVALYSHNMGNNKDITITLLRANTKGNLNTTSFGKLNEIPSLFNSWENMSHAAIANGSQVEAGTKNAAFTLTFLNTPSLLRQSVYLHDQLVSTLSQKLGAENFISQLFHQPLPSYYSKLSQQHSDGINNMLGLENLPSNAIMWTAGVAITNGDDAALAVAQVELGNMTERMKEFARKEDGLVELIYLNYAHPSQDPLGSYGKESIVFLEGVAKRYDPEGWFQSRVPGGFKLSRVAF